MIYPDVQDLTNQDLKVLCDAYRKNNFIDPEISEKLGVKRGLRNADGTGVLAGLTNICDVIGYQRDENNNIIPIDGKLIYRGIDLNDIVNEAITQDRFLFEEVAWLLLFGSLPNKETLDNFRRILETHRELPDGFAETQIMAAPSPNLMNKMARSVLAMYSYDEEAENTSLENVIKQSINLIAEMPSMMVYAYQTKKHAYDHESLYFHYPKPGLSTAENILAMYRLDQNYTREEARLLDLCMIVHADHGGGNNSAFTTRVLSSTGTDTYSAIASAILSLKGPKHGGANLMVMKQLDEILANVKDVHSDEEMKDYLTKIINKEAGDHSGLIYGIGHAVYTKSDPRAQILKKHSKDLAYEKGMQREYDCLCQIEKLAPVVFKELKGSTKNVCANVDLFSGLVYRILGISEELFTPIFAISRVAGWCAHRMEEVEFANRIIRPAYKYVGDEKQYISLEKR
ncbi:MAG: citrate synthase [Bulleidia sp.]|jgi:citrate synthase|nr:citrate synthase [Erysipelotrichaceae bacterium 7770_A6]MEE0559531.1 citrate synthase [Bulleidia sp.]